MSNKKPIKRNENLVVFSHEHHHGLVFCTRLKKAGKTDEKTICSFVKDFWENDLSDHFEREERILLPLLWDNEITKQFLAEHDQIKTRIQRILNNKNKTLVDDAITLSKLINDHIRFEERTMFPWLEKVLTPEELRKVGEELENKEVAAHNFSPEFWK